MMYRLVITTILLVLLTTSAGAGEPEDEIVGEFKKIRDTISTSAPLTPAKHRIEFTYVTDLPSGSEITIVPETGYFHIPDSLTYQQAELFIKPPQEDEWQQRGLSSDPVPGDAYGLEVESGSDGQMTIILSEDWEPFTRLRLEVGEETEEGMVAILNPEEPGSYAIDITSYDPEGQVLDQTATVIAVVEPVEAGMRIPPPGPPERYDGRPEGRQPPGTSGVVLSLKTNIDARCRFAEEEGVSFRDMENSFDQEYVKKHSTSLSDLSPGEYTFYVRCENRFYQRNDDDYEISFELPPGEGEDGDGEGEDEEEQKGDEEEGEDENGAPGRPGGGGGGGGGGAGDIEGPDEGQEHPPTEGSVVFEGWAYPDSKLVLLKDGQIAEEINISDANFSEHISDIDYGSYSFAVYAVDPNGERSATKSSTMTVRSDTVNLISDIFIPPTLGPSGEQVDSDGEIELGGYTIPEGVVEVQLLDGNEEMVATEDVEPDSLGRFWYEPDIQALSSGIYTVRVRTVLGENTRKSDWTEAVFGVEMDPETEPSLTADLNNDGSVGLADFSILLYHWNTGNPAADINNDGFVGLADFSIMMHQWTG